MKQTGKAEVVIGAFLIALGLVGAGYFVGQTLYKMSRV